MTLRRSRVRIPTCLELDSLVRPARSIGATQEAWRKVVQTLRGRLSEIISCLPQWRGPECKHLGGSGSKPERHTASLEPLSVWHYVIVRQDLPRGVLTAQVIHAAGESSTGSLPAHTRAVALAAQDQKHLEELEQSLLERKIPHRAIREPDAPWNNALMAIGLSPISDRSLIKPITGSLKLLR